MTIGAFFETLRRIAVFAFSGGLLVYLVLAGYFYVTAGARPEPEVNAIRPLDKAELLAQLREVEMMITTLEAEGEFGDLLRESPPPLREDALGYADFKSLFEAYFATGLPAALTADQDLILRRSTYSTLLYVDPPVAELGADARQAMGQSLLLQAEALGDSVRYASSGPMQISARLPENCSAELLLETDPSDSQQVECLDNRDEPWTDALAARVDAARAQADPAFVSVHMDEHTQVNQSYPVAVSLAPVTELPEEGEDMAIPAPLAEVNRSFSNEAVISEPTTYSTRMRASIVAPEMDVELLTDEWQIVTPGAVTEWNWRVRPLAVGSLRVVIRLEMDAGDPGAPMAVPVQSFPRTIIVDSSPFAFIGEWAAYLWAHIIPILGVLASIATILTAIPMVMALLRSRADKAAKRKAKDPADPPAAGTPADVADEAETGGAPAPENRSGPPQTGG